MNFGKLYTDLTKNAAEEAPPSVSDIQTSEARLQAKENWKESTITQEFVISLREEISTLIASSISLAISYPQTANHHQIIQNLTKVETLSKILDNHIYGK